MDELHSAEETTFVVDEVSNVVKESVEGTIGGSAYQQNKVNQWTSNVVEQCLNQLTKLGKPFKYIVRIKLTCHVGCEYIPFSCDEYPVVRIGEGNCCPDSTGQQQQAQG